jgi:hypothetical protein
MLAAGASLVTGCGADHDRGPTRPSPTPAPDPDLALIRKVIEDKRALLARYAATVDRFPGLTGRLAPFRADHVGHLAALDAPPDPGPTASPSATPTPEVPAVPAERRGAARALAKAEQAAADRRVGHCVDARDRDLARLLAAIGGCEAAHGLLLDALADELPAEPRPKRTAAPKSTERPT